MEVRASFRRVNLRVRLQSIILFCTLLTGCEIDASGERARKNSRADDGPNHGLEHAPAIGSEGGRIRGVTLDAREPPSDSVLWAIRDLGATHLTLVSFGFQERAESPTIRYTPDVRWYSESESGIRELAARADELGMKIILKPQIWLRGGAWTAEIDFPSDADWRQWSDDYTDYLMYVARLADDVGAEVLVIGTELGNAARARPEFWRQLIAEIRDVYFGKLTYAANWHDDYEAVPFWDLLDFIGIQAYFPLASGTESALQDFREGWADPIAAMESLSDETDLPVLFTEIGYRSVSYAAVEPWRWPSREETALPDTAVQADLYRAFFDEVWRQPWFAGAIIWKYYPNARGRSVDLDFTPQGKPAEAIIRDGFGR